MQAEYIAKITGDTSGLKKAIEQANGMTRKLEDDEVLIKLEYDGNIKQFNKVVDGIVKQCPELSIQFQYDINKKILNQQLDKLKDIEDFKLDVDMGNVQTKINSFVTDIKDGFESAEYSEDELYKKIKHLFQYTNTAKKLGINVDESVFKYIDDIAERYTQIGNLVYSNRKNNIQLFQIDGNLDKTLTRTKDEIEDINNAMSDLRNKGASDTAKSEAGLLSDEIKILKSDIKDMQEEMKSLSGQKFEEMTEKVYELRDALSEVQQKLGIVSKVSSIKDLEKLLSGGVDSSSKNTKIKYWDNVVNSVDKLDEKTKALLKDLGLLNDSKGLTAITDGANNYGGLIGEYNTAIVRPVTDNRTLESTLELKNALDKAYESGVNCSRILDVIQTESGNAIIELQETAKGAQLAVTGNESTGYMDIFNEDALQASSEQLQKLYSDAKKLWDLGLETELTNPGNLIYDQKIGFTIIDYTKREADSLTTFEEIWNDFIENMKANAEDFNDIGNIKIGNSLNEFVVKAEKAGQTVANSLTDGMRDGLDSHSDSKETAKIADDEVNGFIHEAQNRIDEFKQVGKEQAEAVLEGQQEVFNTNKYSDILNKDFSTSGKREATDQLRNTYKEYQKYWGEGGIDYGKITRNASDEGRIAAYNYAQAYKEALSKGISNTNLEKYSIPDFDRFTNITDVNDTFSDIISFIQEQNRVLAELGNPKLTSHITDALDIYMDRWDLVRNRTEDDYEFYKDEGVIDQQAVQSDLDLLDKCKQGLVEIINLEKTQQNVEQNQTTDNSNIENIEKEVKANQELADSMEKVDKEKSDDSANQITKQSAKLTAEEANAMADLFDKAIKAAEAKEKFATANKVVLSSIIESLKGLNSEGDGFNQLNNLINKLSNNNKMDELVKNLKTIRDTLSESVNPDSFINAIKEIANQGDNLKDLATVLKATATQIKNAKNTIGNSKDGTTKSGESSKNNSKSRETEVKRYINLLNKRNRLETSGLKSNSNRTKSWQEEVQAINEDIKEIEKLNLTEEERNRINRETALTRISLERAQQGIYDDEKTGLEVLIEYQNKLYDAEIERNKLEAEDPKLNQGKIELLKKEEESYRDIITSLKELGILQDPTNNETYEVETLEKKIALEKVEAQIREKIADDSKKEAKESSNNYSKQQNLLKQVNSWITKNSNAYKAYKTQLDAILNSLSSNAVLTAEELQQVRNSFTQIVTEATKAGKTGATFADIVKSRWKALAAYLTTFTSFYDFVRYGRNYVTMIQEFDTALTEMRKVSDETVESLKAFQKESFGIADSVGSTALVIQNSTADWMRLGESIEEAKESAKDASILLNVSEFSSIDEATESLVSMSQAYSDMDKMDIIDKLNNIGNNFSISTDQLATGLQNAAAVLKTQGNDIDESIALLTAANSVVQDISKASTGLRTISLRIAGTEEAKAELQELGEDVEDYIVQTASKTQQTIKDYTATALNPEGVDVLDDNGNLRDTYSILLDIAEVYKTIQEEDKEFGTNRANALVEYIAGKNRSNIAASILNDPNLLRDVYESSQNSEGSAMEENKKYLDSIEGRINVLKNRWQEIWASDEANKAIKDVIALLQRVLDTKQFTLISGAVKTLVNLIDLLANNAEILEGIIFAIVGSTVLKSTKNLITYFQDLYSTLKNISSIGDSIKSISDITGGKEIKISDLSQSINSDEFTSKINQYRMALTGLSEDEAVFALSAKGATEEQARQILGLKDGKIAINGMSAEVAETAIKQQQWADSTSLITQANWNRFLSEESLDEEIRSRIVNELGLQGAIDGGAISTEGLTQAELRQKIMESSLSVEHKQLILDLLGLQVAEDKTRITTGLLTYAFSQLKSAWATNKIGVITTGFTILTTVISGIITLYNKHKQKVEEARREIEDLVDTFEKTNSEFKKNKSTFNELAEQYSELSKGVNSLGENISLSASEFDEYHEVANKIAELSPNLVKGWDEEGNAILTVKDNVNELTEAYKNQQIAAYNSIIKKGSDVVDKTRDDLSTEDLIETDTLGNISYTYGKALDELEKIFRNKNLTIDDLDYFKDIIGAGTDYESVDYTRLLNLLKDAGLNPDVYAYDETGLTEFLNNLSDEDRISLQGFLVERESLYSDTVKANKDLFDAYMGELLLSEYEDLDSDLTNVLLNISNSLNSDLLASLNEDEIFNYVKKITEEISSLSGEDKEQFIAGINLQTQWNNEELTYDEYINKINALDDLLTKLFPKDEDIIKTFHIMLDIPTPEEAEDATDTFENIVTQKIKEKSGKIYNEESDKIADWGLEKYRDQIENGTLRSVYGNIDMDNRKIIQYDEEYLEKHKEALESWDSEDAEGNIISYYDDLAEAIENGESRIDTVFGGEETFTLNKGTFDPADDESFDIAFSPILQTEDGGEMLSSDTVSEYINAILDKAEEQGDLSPANILKLDAEGIEGFGTEYGELFVHGLIAGINGVVDSDGTNIPEVGSLMHFAGNYGATKIIYDSDGNAIAPSSSPLSFGLSISPATGKKETDLEKEAQLKADEWQKMYDEWKGTLEESELEFVNNLDSEQAEIVMDFTTTQELDDWLDGLLAEVEPVEIDVTFSTDAVEGLDKLSDAFEGGLDDVFDEVLGDEADSTFASASNLQSVTDDFGGVTFNFGDDELADANAMSNAIEAFNDAMTDNDNILKAAEGDTSAYQDAVDQLATAYIDQSGILDDLTEDNYEYYISMLKAKGVTNAEEVVLSRLGDAAKTTAENISKLSLTIAQYKDEYENAKENDNWGELSTEAHDDLVESTKNLLDSNGLLAEEMTDDEWFSLATKNFEDVEAAVNGDIDALKELRTQLVLTEYQEKYGTLDDSAINGLQDAIANMTAEEYEGLANGTLKIEDTDMYQYLIALQNLWDVTTEEGRKDYEDLVSLITGGSISTHWETQYINGKPTWVQVSDWNGSSTGVGVDDLSNPSDDDSSDSDSDDDDETDISYSEESWDWIETAIDRLESQIDRLDQEVENTYDNWSKRNGALAEEIDAITQEIEMQSDAADKYYEEAEEINLPDDYKLKVQNGEMDVETINESNITDAIIDYYNDLLAQGIGDAEDIEAYNNGELQNSDYVDMLSDSVSDYTDLYEKSMDAADEVVSLTLEKQGLFQQYFDNLKDEYEDFIDIIDAKVDWIEERIDRTEEHGYFVDESYYQDLLANEKDNYATLMAERDELIEAMNTAVSTGGIEKGSSAWNEMYEDILSVNQAIEESLTNTVKLNNEIRQLNWDKFDYLEERLSDINDEAEFFIKLLSGEEMYDDYGMFNSRGWANAAMVASKYNDTLMKAKRYEEELLEVEQELADDPYNKDLIERKEELVQTYRDAIEAAEDEKAAMKSLVEEGINKNLSALQELIDEYKEAMQSAKDLYDWQKNVNDQTENIANLQKQLAAYEGDDSEETRKRRQELQNQLEDAEESLEESQWDHYITETNDMLSELYDSYEETLNSRLDNIDLLMQDMIGEINSAKTDVSDGLNEVANMYGYSTTNFQDFMSGSYSDDLVSKFENGEFSTAVDSLTAIENSVSGITDKILAAQDTYYNGVIDAITEGNDYTLQVNDDGTITKISGSSGTSGSGNSAPTSSGSGAGNSDGGGTWQQDGQKWWYQYSDGSYAQNGFKNIDDKQYYFDENGYMISDQFVQGKWLDHNGEASGEYQWKEDGSDWTYENNDGNTIKNAWAAIDGEWYYFDENGHMVTGKYSIAGKSYSFGTNGKWLGYAKGTKNVPSNQLAFTQENGQELIFSSASGAILTPLGKGDKVFTAEMTDRLWDFAQGNLPDNINKMEKPNIVSSNMNNITANNAINIELPNVTNYDEFKSALKNDGEMEKFWQEITIGKAMGNNSLKKHSI